MGRSMTILNPQFKKTVKEQRLNTIYKAFESKIGNYIALGLNDVMRNLLDQKMILKVSKTTHEAVSTKILEGIRIISQEEKLNLSEIEIEAWALLFRLSYAPIIANESGAMNLHFNFKEISIRGLFDICFGYMLGKHKNEVQKLSIQQIENDIEHLITLLNAVTALPVSEAKKQTLLHHVPLLLTEDFIIFEEELEPHVFAVKTRIEDTVAYSDEKLIALSQIFQDFLFDPHIKEGVGTQPNRAFSSYIQACYDIEGHIDPVNVLREIPLDGFNFSSMDFIAHTIISLNNRMISDLYEPHEYSKFGEYPFGFCGALITLSAFSCEVSFTTPSPLNPLKTLSSDFHVLDWKNDDFNANLQWVADHLVSFYQQGYGGYTAPNKADEMDVISDFVRTDMELILRFKNLAALSEINITDFIDVALKRAG